MTKQSTKQSTKLDRNTAKTLRQYRRWAARHYYLVPPLVTMGTDALTLGDDENLGESDLSIAERGFKVGDEPTRNHKRDAEWSHSWRKHLDALQAAYAADTAESTDMPEPKLALTADDLDALLASWVELEDCQAEAQRIDRSRRFRKTKTRTVFETDEPT